MVHGEELRGSPGRVRELLLEDTELDDTSSSNETTLISNESSVDNINAFENLGENYDKIYYMHTNARSLPPKIGSLLDYFDEFGLDFAIITESWLASGARLDEELRDLELGTDLMLVYKNRPLKPSRGGVPQAVE